MAFFRSLQKSGDKPGRVKNLLFSVIMVLSAFALLELCGYVFARYTRNAELTAVLNSYSRIARRETTGFMPAPYVSYRLMPNYMRVEAGKEFTTHNPQGFRDSLEYSEKKQGVLRIVCLGGSTTYGAGVDDNGQTYPSQLQKTLRRALSSSGQWPDVEVFNLGVGGYTSAEVLTNLHFYALPLKPDIILIQSAINDVAPRFYDSFDLSYEHFRKPMEPLEPGGFERLCYRSRFIVILGWGLGFLKPATLQSRTQYDIPDFEKALENLTYNPTDAYKRNLEAAIVLSQSAGVRVWLLTQAYFDPGKESYTDSGTQTLEQGYQTGLAEHNQILREVAKEKEVGLIDLDLDTPRDHQYFVDPIHMSARGNVLKAEVIAEALLTGLKKKQ